MKNTAINNSHNKNLERTGKSAAQIGVIPKKMKTEFWKKARDLMLPYDGGATQIHVLSLPAESIIDVVDVILSSVTNPKVSLASNGVPDGVLPLKDVRRDDLVSEILLPGQSTITSKIFGDADLTFDFSHAAKTHPTIFLHSTNQAFDEYLELNYQQIMTGQTDGFLTISGGGGANIELYGSAHATLPNQAYIDADYLKIRDEAGGNTALQIEPGNNIRVYAPPVFSDNVVVSGEEAILKTRYTIDLVEHLIEQGYSQIHLVVGADAYLERHQWHRWDDLISKVFLFPVGRKGVAVGERDMTPDVQEVSSTQIRRLLAEGRLNDCKDLVPRAVLRYIQEQGLYGVTK